MSEIKTKHMFAGGNTAFGFFSYYDYIIDWEEAKEIYILKGGPGTGKSTFMKYIGCEAEKYEYDVEYFHCSSDSDSLDGIVIPKLKVAMIDGTSPHIIDPRYPGVVDKIVNLGEFWNQSELIKNKLNILEKRKETKKYFNRAYRYLKSAGILYEDIESFYNSALNIRKMYKIAEELIEDLFKGKDVKTAEKESRQRHLFASAITPKGFINYLDNIITTSKIYKIEATIGTAQATERLISKIKESVVEKGYYVECFYCALFPKKLEHIVIPELDISFTTANKYHNAQVKAWKTIDLSECYNKNMLNKYQQVIEESEKEFNTLLNIAVNSINKAKVFHHDTERYYFTNMDFESLRLYKENIKNKMLR